MNNSIVVVGSCMMDFVCYSARLPKEGETLHGYKFAVNYGGKGANQCVAAHKLGGKSTMIARVGDDLWGDRYIQNFKDLGIDSKYVQKTANFSNGIAQISVADSGANQIIIVAGANSQLSIDDIQNAKTTIAESAVLITQLETSPTVAIEAMKLCKGVSILNGAPGLSEYDPELLTTPSIFCVNETEASVFAGMPVETLDDAKTVVEFFLSKCCKSVIITLGAQGAVFASMEDPTVIHIPSVKIECIDSTGAGDAFVGSLAYLLANYKKLPMKYAIDSACFIAAESCKEPGTQCSFPDAHVLNEYIQEKYSMFL